MDQRVNFVTIGTTDLARARRFYVGGLGWKPLFEVPDDVLFFQVGHGLTLSVWRREALLAESGGGDAGDGVPPMTLSVNVASESEVDSAYELAVAAGGRPLAPPARAEWGGYIGYLADPDGFRWEIAHNPGWSVDADGTVRLDAVD